MRDTIVILSICAAAIIIGASMYFYGPERFRSIYDTQPAAPLSIPTEHVGPVEFVVIDEGDRAVNISDRKNYLVNGEEELQRLWTMVYGASAPPKPALDFMQHDVIAVFMGEAPSGGHAITISGIEDTADARIVRIMLTAPGEGCMTSQAITSPYQLVRVPISSLPLTKEYAETTADCE
jgi:hypothetical protein